MQNIIDRKNNDPTIFIIDDDPEMRNSLRWLVHSVQLNVETFEDAKHFLKNYNVNRIGCILLDIRMPEMSGLELLDTLNTMNNNIPVIVITGHGDIPMAIRAMKSGALDFILKPFNDQELVELMQKAISLNTSNVHSIKPKQNESLEAKLSTLTPREQEIMALVVEGKLNKEIALELKIAISTVELHRAKMMKKMQAKNIAQLVNML